MRQHLANGDALLAVTGELGPVARYRLVQAQPPPVNRHQKRESNEGLADRERVDSGLGCLGRGAGLIGPASAQIEYRLARRRTASAAPVSWPEVNSPAKPSRTGLS